jgi:uncharacterized small protein (DUF1192 family)
MKMEERIAKLEKEIEKIKEILRDNRILGL